MAAAGSGAFMAACSLDTPGPRFYTHADALIAARPGTPTAATPPVGYSALGISNIRDGLLYIPTTYQASTPAPLVVLLHNSGGSAQFWEDGRLGELIDDLGIVIMAPDSRFSTWDFFEPNVRGYGPDPKFINIAMAYTFQRCNIDPQRVALGGFVDGGFEALGVGLANGDLFTHLIAHSPSGLIAPYVQGKPKVFVSVGDEDGVAVDYTKTYMVQKLIDAQYTTEFVQFAGGRILPPDVARQSFEWFLA